MIKIKAQEYTLNQRNIKFEVIGKVQELNILESGFIPSETLLGDDYYVHHHGRLIFRRIPKFIGIKIDGVSYKSFVNYFNGSKRSGSAKTIVKIKSEPLIKVYTYVIDATNKVLITKSVDRTNKYGYLTVNIESDNPGDVYILHTLIPVPEKTLPYIISGTITLPNAIKYKITFWHIRVSTSNKTDVWARFQGRAIWHQPLPGVFWHRARYIIGLAGYADWREIVPVLSGHSFKYMVGVSAACNTPEPRPPRWKCCEYRKRTWWHAIIYARKHVYQAWSKVGEDDINESFHITGYFTDEGFSYLGRCVSTDVACGWEKGPSCSEV